MKQSPCLGCKEHTLHCRPGCKRFAEWIEIHNNERRIIWENRQKDMIYDSYVSKRKPVKAPPRLLKAAKENHIGIQPIDDV